MLKQTLTPLPCPFCGETPKVGPEDPEIEGNAWGFVACVNSGCLVQPRVEDGISMADDRGSGAYQNAAIMRWNKRGKTDEVQPESAVFSLEKNIPVNVEETDLAVSASRVFQRTTDCYYMPPVDSRNELTTPPEGQETAIAFDRSKEGVYFWVYRDGAWGEDSVLFANTLLFPPGSSHLVAG